MLAVRQASLSLQGDTVTLKVNKLTSIKTQLPYEYYSIPYCRPETIVSSAENLGEVLRGDRIENSLYEVRSRGQAWDSLGVCYTAGASGGSASLCLAWFRLKAATLGAALHAWPWRMLRCTANKADSLDS